MSMCVAVTGPIPPALCDCERLQELDLYQNSLEGSLPRELGKLQNLVTLQVQHNNLSGGIPPSLCDLVRLSKLNLRGNCMSGKLPQELGRMRSLVFLSLRNNDFGGRIPLSIGACKALEFLNLSSNQLSGEIPDALGELEDLEYLYLFDNALEGRVPGCLARLKYLKECDVRDNRLRGELPNFLDGCSSLEAVMNKWKNRKANYKHWILGDPVPGAASIASPPNSSHMFLQSLESTPENSSAVFLHPTIDDSVDSGLEDDFSGNNQLVAEFTRKIPPELPRDKRVHQLPEAVPVEAI